MVTFSGAYDRPLARWELKWEAGGGPRGQRRCGCALKTKVVTNFLCFEIFAWDRLASRIYAATAMTCLMKMFYWGRIVFNIFKHADIQGVRWHVMSTVTLDKGHCELTIPFVKGHHVTNNGKHVKRLWLRVPYPPFNSLRPSDAYMRQ